MKSPCVQVGRVPALGLPGAADLGEEAEHVGRGGGGRLERLLAQPQVSWRLLNCVFCSVLHCAQQLL